MNKKKTEAKIIQLFQDTPKSVLELLSENLKQLDHELEDFFDKNKMIKSQSDTSKVY